MIIQNIYAIFAKNIIVKATFFDKMEDHLLS